MRTSSTFALHKREMSGTRSSFTTKMTELVGSPEDLPNGDLPTRRCILRKMLLEKMVESREVDRYIKHVTNIEMAEKVAKSTLTFWKKVNAKIVGALVTEQEILVEKELRVPDISGLCRAKVELVHTQEHRYRT